MWGGVGVEMGIERGELGRAREVEVRLGERKHKLRTSNKASLVPDLWENEESKKNLPCEYPPDKRISR